MRWEWLYFTCILTNPWARMVWALNFIRNIGQFSVKMLFIQFENFWHHEPFDVALPFTTIVLIPKKKNLLSILNLRPISLFNVLYKIISKVLSYKSKLVIDDIISYAQSAFILGRLIIHNIMISYEIMHYMKRKTGYMAIKLDMNKAYDRVEWGYLQAILFRMGFDRKFVRMLMICVTSACY